MRIKLQAILLFVFATGFSSLSAQEIAVKTNLFYAGLMQTLNIGTEWKISPKLTLDLWGAYNPFPLGKNGYGSTNKKMKHWIIRPELRYWLCESFNGHFFGGHVFYGQYNISNIHFLGTGNYRKQGNAVGVGISYGYQWILSPHWSMEGAIGIGYARLHYNKYPCKECGKRISTENRNYLGPTRAAISFIYLLK
ncbi:DUF3575 domain-containing protein [Parabacteroides sp. APC149_11_2_Y6]